jgi:hypothetical protein
LLILKSGERERLKWREKRLEILTLERERERERETWNESEILGEKKERVWRERGKKGERERETYEPIQEKDIE